MINKSHARFMCLKFICGCAKMRAAQPLVVHSAKCTLYICSCGVPKCEPPNHLWFTSPNVHCTFAPAECQNASRPTTCGSLRQMYTVHLLLRSALRSSSKCKNRRSDFPGLSQSLLKVSLIGALIQSF